MAESRVINFGAGPGALPLSVLEIMRDEMLNAKGTGMSVCEMSHRGAAFQRIIDEAEKDLRTLLKVPDNYKVLFLQGGGTGQFAAVPLNLCSDEGVPVYITTGSWSKGAAKEAKKFCRAGVTQVGPDEELSKVVTESTPYVYVCTNETVDGVFFDPASSSSQSAIPHNVPLVADMSSEILTRDIDVSRYGLIFAGAQKNVGISGVTLVIVRDDLIGKPMSICPAVFDYTAMADKASMLNTPPTMAIYVAGLVFKWALQQGGVASLATTTQRKAAAVYAAISQRCDLFSPIVKIESRRSLTNIVWTLSSSEEEKRFVAQAKAQGMSGLAGHRSVGGIRASVYNATTLNQVEQLVAFIEAFKIKE